MKHTKLLRTLVIIQWVFSIAGIPLSIFLADLLPIELKQWIDADLESGTTSDIVLFLLLLPPLVASIAGSIGLYRLKKWGSWTYLGSLIIFCLLLPFTGPTVEHAITSVVYEIEVIITGMIIALAFFTDTLSGNKNSNS